MTSEAAPETPLRYPERLGPYLLGRLIGVGATGCVFEASDASGRSVALKVIHQHLAAREGFRRQIEREARLAQAVSSPHTVPLIDAGEDGGYHYLVLELVRGPSLAELLRGNGTLPRAEALRIFSGVVAGLADLHAAGIVHRDVKPSNVLLGDGGRVLLTDYGIARDILATGTTSSVDFAGSLAYAAPEQASERWDFRADIYAAGATLTHMLSGSPPERHGLLAGLPRGLGRRLAEQLASADPALAAVAARCLALDPRDRYPSSSALLEELDAIEQPGSPARALTRAVGRRLHLGRRGAERTLTRPRVAAAAAAAAIVSAAGLGLALARDGGGTVTCEVRPPLNVRAAHAANGDVAVTWERGDECVPAGYRVAWGADPDRSSVPRSQVLETGISDGRRSALFTLVGLPLEGPQYVWVDAYGENGASAAAPYVSVAPAAACQTVPSPTALEALGTSVTAVQLGWRPGGECAVGYRVYYSTGDAITGVNPGQRPSDGIIDAGARTEITVPGLEQGRTYSFWVIAYGPGETRADKPAGPVTARVYPTPFGAATLIDPPPGTVLDRDEVTFRWAPGRHAEKYDFHVSGIGRTMGDVFDMRDGPDLSATVSGIPQDGRTVYVWLLTSDGTDANLAIREYQFVTRDSGEARTERTYELSGTQAWLDTGMSFHPADRIEITATGNVWNTPSTGSPGYGPDGGCPSYPSLLVPTLPCMSLVGQYLGVAPFLIGSHHVFIADRGGTLVLGVNDGEHRDNRGSWQVEIRVTR